MRQRIDAAADRLLEVASRPWFNRLASLGIAAGVGTVFVLAALLVPAGDGHGTHLQLGLGSCTFLTITGFPCPMCGATTSFALMAHLRVVEAFLNQPFAAGLFLLSAGVFAVAVAEAVDPRGRWTAILDWLAPREGWLAAGFLGAMGVGWAYKVLLMNFLG